MTQQCPECGCKEIWDEDCTSCNGMLEDDNGDECELCEGSGYNPDHCECSECGHTDVGHEFDVGA